MSDPRNQHLGVARRVSAALVATAMCACAASPALNPACYRLSESGDHWDVSGSDAVFEDLSDRYPDFFAVITDPTKVRVPDLRRVRDDLEHQPVDRRNFDALNAVAIAYYETNYRAEADRGDGLAYLALSQRSAKLLAVPWRAYGETDDARLRTAILDFFEDAGSGRKLLTAATSPRLIRVVDSLKKKEGAPERAARIESLVRDLEARALALEGTRR